MAIKIRDIRLMEDIIDSIRAGSYKQYYNQYPLVINSLKAQFRRTYENIGL